MKSHTENGRACLFGRAKFDLLRLRIVNAE
jgi:hypothetical protein